MEGKRWARLRRIFEDASDLPVEARAAFLDGECAGDPELRDEVERMLASDTDAPEFLGTPAVLPLDPLDTPTGFQPTRVGQYEIVRPIASGGMGVVYEAQQENPQRRVAVKMLRSGVLSESIRRRFLYEAEVLGRLRHPGIAQIHEAGVHVDASGAEAPYFAMEYVPGARDVLSYAREQGLDLRARLALFAELCDAVHHGHQQGVVHRDIKPANLLVDETGRPKVIDFGVARATDADLMHRSLATKTGEIVGTLRYMSPEQLTGDPAVIDTRTDVYSLGFVLYELVSGETPYDVDGKTFTEALMTIRDATPVDPRRRMPALPADVAWVTLRALEKEPDRRYRSASELAADVRRILDHEPVEAGPPSTVYRLRKFVRRHRVATAAAGLVAVALTAGGALAAAGYVEAADQAAKFRSINQVLTDLLVSVQTGVDGRDVRVVELLDRVAGELESDLEERPEVAAALHATLAESYFNLGIYADAEQQARRALELLDGRVAERDPERLAAWTTVLSAMLAQDDERAEQWIAAGLGIAEGLPEEHEFVIGLRNGEYDLAFLRGDHALAIEGGRELWERARVSLGPDHELTLVVLGNLVLRMAARDVDDEALRLAREMHDATVRVHGEGSFKALHQRLLLARYLSQRGDHDAARREFDAALPRLMALGGEEHPRVVVAMQDLGLLYLKQGEHARAAAVLESCLKVSERTRGPEHSTTLRIKANLANARGAMGDPRAEGALRETLETRTLLWGKEHPGTVRQMIALGTELTKQSRHAEAEPLLQEALVLARTLEGDDPGLVRGALHALAYFSYTINDFEEARPYFQEALERHRRELGGAHPDTLRIANNYVAVLGRLERYQDAIPVALELAGIQRDTREPDHPARMASETNLAWLHMKAGNFATAAELFAGCLDVVQEHLGPDDPLAAKASANLGKALLAKGDVERALAALDEAIARAEFEPRIRRWDFAGWRQERASCLRRLGRFEAAEADLLVVDEIVSTLFSEHDPNRRSGVTDLIALYEEWERPDDAKAWRETLAKIRERPVR